MKLFALVFLLMGCGVFVRHEPATPKSDDRLQTLRTQFANRLEALQTKSDPETGWPERWDCDGTLWAGLALAAGSSVNLELADYGGGEIHRRPAPACYPKTDGLPDSKATVSQDMLTGYFAGLWATKNLAALQRVAAFGEAAVVGHAGGFPVGWIMGAPYPEELSRVVLRTNGIGLVGRMIYVLSGGADDRSYRKIPPVYGPVLEPYEKFLQAVGILTDAAVAEAARQGSLDATPVAVPGDPVYRNLALSSSYRADLSRFAANLDVTDNELGRLQELAKDEPENPLFQAALGVYTGSFDRAVDLLLAGVVPPYPPVDTHPLYADVAWLTAARTVLGRFPEDGP